MFFLDMSIRNESFEGLLSGYTVKCSPRDQEVGGSILARRSEILRPYLTFREVYGMCAYELIHKSTSKLSFRMLMSKKTLHLLLFDSLSRAEMDNPTHESNTKAINLCHRCISQCRSMR